MKRRGGYIPGRHISGGRLGGKFPRMNKNNPNHTMKAIKALTIGALQAAFVKGGYDGVIRASNKIDAIPPGTLVPIGTGLQGGAVRAPDVDFLPVADLRAGAIVKETKRNLSSTGMVNSSRKYFTKWETGELPGKSIRATKAQNGSYKKVLYDTMVQDTVSGTPNRNSLIQSTGFNQRKYFAMNDETYITYADVGTEYNYSSADRPAPSEYQNVYGNLMNIFQTIRLHNSGSYYPVIVKVHYVTTEKNQITPLGKFRTIFNEALGTQDRNAMPLRYQFEDRSDIAGHISSCNCSTKGSGIWGSQEAKKGFQKVKTFTKRLSPGDTWELSHKMNFKSGINLSGLFGALNGIVANTSELGYYPIIEFQGVPCEAIKNNNTSETYIGTSPSFLSVEVKKGLEYVLPDATGTAWTGDGITNRTGSVRVYIRNDDGSSTMKEKFLPMVDIGPATGQYTIPTMSDMFVADAAQRT